MILIISDYHKKEDEVYKRIYAVSEKIRLENHLVNLKEEANNMEDEIEKLKNDGMPVNWELEETKEGIELNPFYEFNDRWALLTAGDKTTGFDSGADDYLVKPFDADEFLNPIKKVRIKYE